MLNTRLMFGCTEIRVLEDLLDRLFSDDLRFVQTGIRPARPSKRKTPSARQQQTYRGAFGVDAQGNLVPGSFEYAPLIDFARHVEHFLTRSKSLDEAVASALTAINAREERLRDTWDEIIQSAGRGYSSVALLLSGVRVRDDQTRYCTTWVGPDDDPAGQLPAFFRSDLLQAATHPTSPLVRTFLSGRPDTTPSIARDLADRSHLEPLLERSRLPRAAWPSGHRLRLSQQVALTAILAEEADPLMAVNGPPGTGKTTLLRDLYANLVARRAAMMITFDDPTKAFGPEQQLGSMNDQRWTLYQPHPKLCGFEMLVASSNNAAAENVTKELPARHEVTGPVGQRLSYFRTAANCEALLEDTRSRPKNYSGLDLRPGLLAPDGLAWGFAAVALGSRDRVGRFEEVVARYTSRRAPGSMLRILAQPPPPREEWYDARCRFEQAARAVEQAIDAISASVADVRTLSELTAASSARSEATVAARNALGEARLATGTARDQVTRYEGAARASALKLEAHLRTRPGWWARLTKSQSFLDWERTETRLKEAANEAAADHSGRVEVLAARLREESLARQALAEASEAEMQDKSRITALSQSLSGTDRSNWVDEDWWARREDDELRDEVELGTAWVEPDLQQLREELFEAALAVHECFLRTCGRQVGANLRTWLALQSSEVQRQSADEAALGAWRSLFLLVPLVSTTFASMSRLMQRIPTASLGWLIIDEAGQAIPSAAVGGLARFQRAVIVGDPSQLEPVVTLPRALVDQLLRHHQAPTDLAPTRASVQTLADSIVALGTVRTGRWVSLPLLVHNRCLDPMFAISNEMAYENKMVFGRTKQGPDYQCLGPSRWIDVPRSPGGHDHFFSMDWEAVQELLTKVSWDPPPSIAVISPFKKVTKALQKLLPDVVRFHLHQQPSPLSSDQIDKAVDAVRVGTVHTFQGRQYDVVILVLGGATAGARSWAAGTPNLLNVAVTRAKDRLYVIGDRAGWEGTGHAATLARHLPPAAGL